LIKDLFFIAVDIVRSKYPEDYENNPMVVFALAEKVVEELYNKNWQLFLQDYLSHLPE